MSVTVKGRGMTFTPISTGFFVVTAGGETWLDVNVSATTGTNTQRIWLVEYVITGYIVGTGIRYHGSAAEPFYHPQLATGGTMMTTVDASGHVDVYRVTTSNVEIRFQGYFS
jgi:hypothetical protein